MRSSNTSFSQANLDTSAEVKSPLRCSLFCCIVAHSPPNELLRLLKVRSVVKGFQALALPRFSTRFFRGVPLSVLSGASWLDAGSRLPCSAAPPHWAQRRERRTFSKPPLALGLYYFFRASSARPLCLLGGDQELESFRCPKVSRFVTVTDGN